MTSAHSYVAASSSVSIINTCLQNKKFGFKFKNIFKKKIKDKMLPKIEIMRTGQNLNDNF